MPINLDRVSGEVRERAESGLPSLPSPARDRFRAMEERNRAAAAAVRGASAEVVSLSEHLTALEDRKAELIQRHRFEKGGVPTEASERSDALIRRTERTLEAAKATGASLANTAAIERDNLNRATAYLAQVTLSGDKLKMKNISVPRSGRDKALESTAETKRLREAEFERVRSAQKHGDEIKLTLASQLAEVAGRDTYARAPDGTWELPQKSSDAVHTLPGRVHTVDDLLPLLLDLFGDEVRARLFARVDADLARDPALRMRAADKQNRLAELRAEILELEYLQAALIVSLAGPDPLELSFPRGMDVRAMLGVVGPVPAPV